MKVSEAEYKTMRERVNGVECKQATHGSDLPRVIAHAHSPYRSKLEAAYAGYLHTLMLAGDLKFYRYEPVRMILAPDCTLTIDFLVMLKDGQLEWHEVKGRRREDAMIKLRVAARTFHWWKFVLVERKRGAWEQRELPA